MNNGMLQEAVFLIFSVLDESAAAYPSGQLTMLPLLEIYVSWEGLCSPKIAQKTGHVTFRQRAPSMKRTMTKF